MHTKKELLSFGEHLEVLRQMLFRILGMTFVFSCVVFCFKTITFDVLLAPSNSSFITYRWVETFIRYFDKSFFFEQFDIDLIATDLSSQFMAHIKTSVYLGILCASPMIIYELFRFISPALLESEKKHSVRIVLSMYILFITGVLMSYYIVFPISFRFLGTYHVDQRVHNLITLDSYISTFTSLTLLMGLVFQMPIVTIILAKMNILSANLMSKYRKHALILILIVSAIITPPDMLTLILVSVPLYLLYECSALLARRCTPLGKQV